MSLRKLLVLPILLALPGCFAPTATNQVAKAQERSTGPLGLFTVASIKTESESSFKGMDKVVIGSFTVGFTTTQVAADTPGAFANRGSSAAHNTLLGVDDATMRAVTDEAYKRFLASLQANGYTVVDRAELLANADFAGSKDYPNPYQDETGGILKAKNVTRYFAPTGFPSIKFFAGDVPDVMGGFALNNPITGATKYAAATGTRVLHVVYLLDFANDTNAAGGRDLLHIAAQVTMAQGMTIVPETSKIGVVAGQGGAFQSGMGKVALGQPITSDKQFATVENTTSAANLGVQTALNVVNFYAGQRMSESRDFTFTARPEDYKLAALDAFDQANTALVNKVASLK